MIEMQLIKNECKKHKRCNEECVFYDTEVSTGCLLCYDPCEWDIPTITKAFEKMSDETYKEMHDALMKKIIDVMHPDDRK